MSDIYNDPMKISGIISWLNTHLEWCNHPDCIVCTKNREAIELVKKLILDSKRGDK